MTDETQEAKALRAVTAERDRFRAALEQIAAQATRMPAWMHAQYVLHNNWIIPSVAFVEDVGLPMYVLTCGYCHQTWQALPKPGVQNDCPDPAGICSCTLECIVSEDAHAAWQIAAKVSP
jgi:hypothetical protein